ncbi:Aldo/keto reductase [Morchella conica CCBAS932]|uniref:Aldo/keto reductase n=1 Tax=Morchella conica CCBAS932 TaxID=1392247 RepID=A0A3N4LC70_9PEZI|nr:Aldo/keto reductase [Morchella conica CCBAS932]
MATQIPTFHLPTGAPIPAIGFGTGTAWYKSESEPLNRVLIDSIKSALALGYRHLDCAEIYGTEPEVGVAIKESGVPREELFIVAKSFKTLDDPEKGLNETLRKLQTDYVDLYPLTIPQIWSRFESLQKSGKTRSIGVSNFTVPQLTSLLTHATIPPTYNQVEFNPYCLDLPLLRFCQSHNIQLAAYSPLGPLTKFPGGPLDAVLKRIAGEKGRTESQVLIRWGVEMGVVIVTTSSKKERQEEFAGVGFELGEEVVREIMEVGGKVHHRIYWTEDYEN